MNGYRYIVLAWRSDCGDTSVFAITDSYGRDHWESFGEARAAMKADYRTMLEDYPAVWMTALGVKRVKKRRRVLRRSSAEFSVPIWDGERKRESFLKCRWRIVRI